MTTIVQDFDRVIDEAKTQDTITRAEVGVDLNAKLKRATDIDASEVKRLRKRVMVELLAISADIADIISLQPPATNVRSRRPRRVK